MDINSTSRVEWSLPLYLLDYGLMLDRKIKKLIRQTAEFTDLLRGILRNASSPDEAVDDSDFEDESGDENFEEGNEVVNLTRSALISLKKLPTLEELERTEGTTTKTAV